MKYRFSEQLDLVKLQEFYDGDISLAAGVFEAFVQETVTALPNLDELYEDDELEAFRKLIHKIKPGFLYVGLTGLYNELSLLEESCLVVSGVGELAGKFEELRSRLKKEVPVVEAELTRLRKV